jgi:hypothetical protein
MPGILPLKHDPEPELLPGCRSAPSLLLKIAFRLHLTEPERNLNGSYAVVEASSGRRDIFTRGRRAEISKGAPLCQIPQLQLAEYRYQGQ